MISTVNYTQTTTTLLDPKSIRTDLGIQSRVGLNHEVVQEYAEAIGRGDRLPPPRVYQSGPDDPFILADGFHRLASHILVKPDKPIKVELARGTVLDALWHSLGANTTHGLLRTNADKRNAIRLALLHANYCSRRQTNCN
jgi:hypothetical protein